ncbi:AMP-binding protein [Pseudoteredinibacter isoporae]|uniref:Fatty-acyl-CoA synthase n=1 Tax=Pseudoteredinibacter isoporae TaxID=570281 RepID=A0A7X0MV36_9GAMM|nr:AMP-binding protein [Pseudoteredinibacter isoporae]MBB6520953.1 fatty-acyl-CoA synthase [Pseudoteredinibacter isoporae]NHO86518.1 AMP-binding protein [Pseudoteredinibacter isoporae]NIB25030.1 AMP-binding protein [Pseudoteredinibacter isoporae]
MQVNSLTQSQLNGPDDVSLLDMTIPDAFDQTVEKFPEALALVVKHQDIRWSYREYQEQIERLASGLLALGIQPGDRVGIWSPNRVEWCLTQFATAKIGAIMVCINPAYRLYELEYALSKVGCKAIIAAESFKTSHYLDMLNELMPELKSHSPCRDGGPLPTEALVSKKLPELKWVIRMGDAQSAGMLNFSELMKLGGESHQEQVRSVQSTLDCHDAINIQFTSGTTGNPKGATLSHHNILNNGKVVGDGMQLDEHDRLCVPVPLYHCFGMVMGNLACITHGSAAIFPDEAFDPLSTLKAVAEESCTALHGVPTMFIAQLDHPEFDHFDLSSLRTGIMAGAPCPAEIMKQVIARMHMDKVLIAYGQTELSPVNHMTAVDDPLMKRVETVGRPGPRLEVKICDELGNVVAIGERGEICTRGYSVMKGYWGEAERTAETIDADGWLHSGDLGVMDAEGFVQVVGRLKDMIIRGGENVYPREVEEFLFTHPAIQDVQVFGIPDEKYGEQVCAWVQLKTDQNLNAEALQAYCKDKITHFKVPKFIEFVEEFPMTVTGKIQKFRMREIMVEQIAS